VPRRIPGRTQTGGISWYFHEEMRVMVTYGLFDGVARRDHLVAAAVYGLEDYVAMHGGTPDDYLDYLLRLDEALNGIRDPVRVVWLPFDMGMYRTWLEGSSWQDGPEARSAWALAVAEDPARLAELKKRYPVLPAAPVDERMTVEVLYLALPVFCEGEEDVDRLARQLNSVEVAELCARLRAKMPPVPTRERLSQLRARGADLFLGDRLVGAGDVEELDGFLRSVAPDEGAEGVVKVPRRFRVKRAGVLELVGSLPSLVPVFLPLVLVGAREDVGFLAEWAQASHQLFLARVAPDVEDLLASAGWGGEKLGRPGPLLEAWEIPEFLDVMSAEFGREEEDPGDLYPDPGPGGRRPPGKRRGLRRIK